MNADDWQSEFSKYQSMTAEYRLQNKGMSLNEFKSIYWWEWGHRLLGRLVGVVFLLPFLTFWALGWTTARLRRRLWALFVLGGLQGAIGWWMVSSGVGDTHRTDVAAYRLMTHFSLALFIIGLSVWVWLELGHRQGDTSSKASRHWSLLLLVLISIQMMFGALVAGLDAGRTYTDWPLMNGHFIPRYYWDEGGLHNLIENAATTQFNHRTLAYVILVLCLIAGWRHARAAGGWFKWLAIGVVAQSVLGIVTLINAAPLHLGLSHQALGTIVLIISIVITKRCFSAERT